MNVTLEFQHFHFYQLCAYHGVHQDPQHGIIFPGMGPKQAVLPWLLTFCSIFTHSAFQTDLQGRHQEGLPRFGERAQLSGWCESPFCLGLAPQFRYLPL